MGLKACLLSAGLQLALVWRAGWVCVLFPAFGWFAKWGDEWGMMGWGHFGHLPMMLSSALQPCPWVCT